MNCADTLKRFSGGCGRCNGPQLLQSKVTWSKIIFRARLDPNEGPPSTASAIFHDQEPRQRGLAFDDTHERHMTICA